MLDLIIIGLLFVFMYFILEALNEIQESIEEIKDKIEENERDNH